MKCQILMFDVPNDYKKIVNDARKELAWEVNFVKVGDIVQYIHGAIKVDKIEYSESFQMLVYEGIRVKKDGEYWKNKTESSVLQSMVRGVVHDRDRKTDDLHQNT